MAGRYDTVQTCDKRSAGPQGWTECRPSCYIILTHYGLHGRFRSWVEAMEMLIFSTNASRRDRCEVRTQGTAQD
jgi:hypothetical protein